MTIPLIIAGILLEANKGWFNGAGTIGLVCLIVGIVGLIIQLLVIFGVAGAFFKNLR